jgi:hypothetical protein
MNEPNLGSFPTANPIGAAALLWATRGKRPVLGMTLHCPRCGTAMTLTEELERRKRRRNR